jgi:hypothetical protein
MFSIGDLVRLWGVDHNVIRWFGDKLFPDLLRIGRNRAFSEKQAKQLEALLRRKGYFAEREVPA